MLMCIQVIGISVVWLTQNNEYSKGLNLLTVPPKIMKTSGKLNANRNKISNNCTKNIKINTKEVD